MSDEAPVSDDALVHYCTPACRCDGPWPGWTVFYTRADREQVSVDDEDRDYYDGDWPTADTRSPS